MKKPELLSPAGNLENLKVAFTYGADAVYLAGKKYGLRAKADNFTLDEIKEGVDFAHKQSPGKKVYVTLNIIPHNSDLEGLPEYIKALENIKIGGVIASDPGIISLIKEISPEMRIHLSTQANNTNYKSAAFWHDLGIKRVTLARELSFEEIKEIVNKTPDTLELEVFVHGSVCISYSGRCMLSKYMINRDANRGECAHPCRWLYSVQEEKRPGEYYDVYEDDKGSYIFNSRDMCLLEHVPALIDVGVTSFKIEGRMKSSYYVAVVTSAYRKAIDDYLNSPEGYRLDPKIIEELKKINHRKYSTNFFNSKPGSEEYIYDSPGYTCPYLYLGIVLEYDSETKLAEVCQQNKIVKGDQIEVIGPGRNFFIQTVTEMFNEKNEPVDSALIPQCMVKIKMNQPVKPLDMLRKK
ncbi:MAG: U32 family peptidase [Elusimicrobia bacterium]|nr:U32 family peptidase [Elusimicrobiota bacterium]